MLDNIKLDGIGIYNPNSDFKPNFKYIVLSQPCELKSPYIVGKEQMFAFQYNWNRNEN
jgi:hypothetical protein